MPLPSTHPPPKPGTYRPRMTQAGLTPTHGVEVVDEHGEKRVVHVVGEQPLTLRVDGREVVTLMTLGTHPEVLALGYLRNQQLIEKITTVKSVNVNWDLEVVDIETYAGEGIIDWQEKLSKRTVTTGCGQGTVFSCTIDQVYDLKLPRAVLKQSLIYDLLGTLNQHNAIYRQAGAVHGCALCQGRQILTFVEDVGRHNATDAIAGMMWLEEMTGEDKIFYTTGRLTSEIVMKVTQMGIPVLLSRSGVTFMGLELASITGLTMIGRAKGRHFLVYNGVENIEYNDTVRAPHPRQPSI